MKQLTFLIILHLIFIPRLDNAQQPAPVKVEQGFLQGMIEDRWKPGSARKNGRLD